MKSTTKRIKTAALLSLSLASPLAWAEPAAVSAPASALGNAVTDDALLNERGKALVTNVNDLDGAVYQNSAQDVITGNNFITDGSFTGNSGLSTVIQNSGNNVLIQNALILNVQVQ